MRLVVLLLSLGTLVLYGRAIAALWSFTVGHPRPGMLFFGLFGGTVTAVSAVLLWKNRLRELDWVKEDEEGQQH